MTGVAGLLVSTTAVWRIAGHVGFAITEVASGRDPRWLLLLVPWIGLDLAAARNVGRSVPALPWRWWLLSSIDALCWSPLLERGPFSASLLVFGCVMSDAMTAGFWCCAGSSAVPIWDRTLAWPPRRDGWRRRLALVTMPFLPVLVMAAARHAQHLDPGLPVALWGVVGWVAGALMARRRARLQSQARLEWERRTTGVVEAEAEAQRFELATASGSVHDVKRGLLILAEAGVHDCRQLLLRVAARPGALAAESSGGLLRHVADGAPIRPAEAATTWVPAALHGPIRRFLAEAEDAALDGASQTVEVVRADGESLRLAYLGADAEFRRDPPPLAAKLDAGPLILIIAAFVKLLGLSSAFGRMHLAVLVPCVAGDLLCAAVLRRQPLGSSRSQRPETVEITLATIWVAAAATPLADRLNAAGEAASLGMNGVLGAGMLLSSYWSELRRWQRPALWMLLVAALAADRIRDPFSLARLAEDVTILVMSTVAFLDVQRLGVAEARALDDELTRDLRSRIEHERAAVRLDEEHEANDAIQIMEDGLTHAGDGLAPAMLTAINRDIDNLKAWKRRLAPA